MSNEQKLCSVVSENISTPIYVECCKMYLSKVCVQEFWYFVSGLDIQLEQSEYYSTVPIKNWLQVAKYDQSHTVFSAIDTSQWLSG